MSSSNYKVQTSGWHMVSERWDRKYLELAKHVSMWSHDPSTKVGAIVVNWDYQQEFLGYNGFPKGVLDTSERYADRELKYKMVVHAEVNAILKAGHLAKGATLYVYPSFSLPPICNECAKVAIQAGIKEVVGYNPDLNDERVKRWLQSIEISQTMFKEAGITWRSLDEDKTPMRSTFTIT
jgi:dCMP deaminase